MRLGWSQQMLRSSGEGTVLNYWVIVVKEFDVQEKFNPEILGFSSLHSFLSSIKVVLHQKPVYNHVQWNVYPRFCSIIYDKLNSQCQFLNILECEL